MNRSLCLLIVLGGLLSGQVPARAADGQMLVGVEGQPLAASLVKVELGWKMTFAAADQKHELAAADLATWGAFVEAAHGSQILIAGGGLLVADVQHIDKEQLRADSDVAGQLKLPLEAVVGVVFRPPTDRARRDQLLARVTATTGDSDRLLLDNGDELGGTVTALHGESLALETAAGKIDVELQKVLAIVLNPALRDKGRASGLRAWVGFRDGSRLLATSLVMDETTAQLKLANGTELQARSEAIVALQILGGHAVYLSDLKAAGYRHVPFLNLDWPYRLDHSASGGQLRAGGKVYLKGLGMHSASRLTYNLDRAYRRFQAEVAIDDETQGQGSVIFHVFTEDGSGKWQPHFASPVVRGNGPVIPVSIDVTGVKRISLLVDFADQGDVLDHADWLNARLVK